jgi:diguanylate cyclase (GGDEF)-like protein/PAS domain S-box-containing protein
MDIRTIALILGITNILQVAALLLLYRVNKTYRGIGWWVSGFISIAVGFVLLIMRDIVSIALVTIFFGNVLIVSGEILLYIGIMRFLGRKENLRIILPIFVVFILPFFYFNYVNNDLEVRTVLVSIALAPLSFLPAQALFVHKPRAIAASANFVSAAFLANSIFFALRAVVTLTVSPVDSFFTPTLLQVAAFVAPLIEGILITYGLIILVNQRLSVDRKEAEEHFELIFNTGLDATVITRLQDGMIFNINEGFTALSGFTRAESIGKSSLEINIWKDPADRQKVVKELSEKGFCENFEAIFQRKDGSSIYGIMSAKIITLKGLPYIISVTRDITERKRLEDDLRKLATTDGLTGVTNRRLFLELAQNELDRAIRYNHPLTIALMDIDHFKHVNDTYKHSSGDQVLLAFVKICQKNIRTIDVFARFGGDEFVLLLPETNQENACEVIERLRMALSAASIDLGGNPISVTTSWGITSLTNEHESLDTLLSRADRALYRAKETGRDRVVVWDSSIS